MEKKYTLEEIRNMFVVAEGKALKEIDKSIQEIGGDEDPSFCMMLSILCISFAGMIYKDLFK